MYRYQRGGKNDTGNRCSSAREDTISSRRQAVCVDRIFSRGTTDSSFRSNGLTRSRERFQRETCTRTYNKVDDVLQSERGKYLQIASSKQINIIFLAVRLCVGRKTSMVKLKPIAFLLFSLVRHQQKISLHEIEPGQMLTRSVFEAYREKLTVGRWRAQIHV